MKRIILFFAVCLGLSVLQTTLADDAETARAASKRATNAIVSANVKNNSNRSVITENKKSETQSNKNNRTATKTSAPKVVNRNANTSQNLKPRTTTGQPTKQQTQNVVKRAVAPARTMATTTRKFSATPVDKATRSAVSIAGKTRNVRAADLDYQKITDIKSANYSKCKTVYYECMDEFCANKDTNLRRCACSSRIHEFDNIKKQLNNAEDKMLDFNQRLLTISLDKEDAAAINVATEGELAFQTKDSSQSEKLLQKITDTLNSSNDSRITNNLASVSLSLDIDSAWDDIDSLSGISTTSKNGLDLYNAAHPVCIEMAKEVCSEDELSIVQDGYKLTIQQDCDTVAKSYKTLYNNAMNKIHESGALLDISRLNVYQQRNSDDTLTCKKKILNQLSDASVCGENLYKCLDISGKYIDPSTGKAFLSADLSNLKDLLQEPIGDEKWSKIGKNESFVNFLNSKKPFLEPAIKQCQDISEMVWKDFLDDALSQIKLAQNAKIEEIKQNCTVLIAECKTNAMNNLSAFDSRALSMFNVAADKTANEMCSDVQNSCIALMGDSADWKSGIAGLATDITYDTVLDTCGQIGRDCIIERCNGTTGNFALCRNIASDNRIAILRRDVCWDKVLACVQSADKNNVANMTPHTTVANLPSYYYPDQDHPDPCVDNDKACLIAKQIWGDCTGSTNEPNSEISKDDSTLLSWFTTNTGNQSCNATGCPTGYTKVNDVCQPIVSTTTHDCEEATKYDQIINVILNSLTNYCQTGIRDKFGNCCADGNTNNGICVKNNDDKALLLLIGTCNSTENYYCPGYNSAGPSRKISVYCITQDDHITDNGTSYVCNGKWVLIDQYGNYFDVKNQSDGPTMTYKENCDCQNNQCDTKKYQYNNTWSFGSSAQVTAPVPTSNEFIIAYP